MKRFLVLSVSVMLLWFGISCSMDMGPSTSDVLASSDTSLPTEPSDSEKSLLRIGVPTVSSAIMDSLDATYQPTSDDGVNSRAILQADSVDFTLSYPAGSGMADYEWSVAATYENVTEDEILMVAAEEVVPGNDLVLTAEVYNSNVSTTDPVVTGTSDPFSVGPGGSVDVPITAIPFQPVDLAGPSATDTTSHTQLSIDAVENTTDPDIMMDITVNSLGGEAWYNVTPFALEANRYARLRISPSSSDVITHIYDSDGSRLNQDVMAMGYEMQTAMMEYLGSGTNNFPTSSRAGVIVPLFDIEDPDNAGNFYYAPDSSFYAGFSFVGINDASSGTADVVYDELVYSGSSSADLLDFTTSNPVIAATTPTDNVFYPRVGTDDNETPGDTSDDEIYLESEGSHFYRLDMADMSIDTAGAANDIDVSFEVDVCTPDFIESLTMPVSFDPTTQPIEELYWESDFLLMYQGTNTAGDTEYYDQIIPNSFTVVEGADRDTITVNYTVDQSVLESQGVDLSTVEVILVLRSWMGGNGYSVSWVNNTPGSINPWIQ